ncbi:hypothetical protein [Pedobacter sp.]|uniref:hypothetical protein n=1 Tax=Pedobacter sp. TaxID=1411316 RepID=UPI003D7F2E40
MEPFNIRVGFGKNEVTLTILPTEEGYYKVIYYGGILGAIQYLKDTDSWEQVPPEDVIAGDLPLYRPDLEEERTEIELTEQMIEEIGEEITLLKKSKE